MRQLVAIDMPAGRHFVESLLRAWDEGDAVAPLDPRLPPPAARALLEALRPSVLVGRDGERSIVPGGLPVEEGDALVVATSGSTGTPKGVVLSHDAVAASAWATSRRLSADPGTDCWLACLPLAHIGGLSVVTRSIVTGTRLMVHDGFDPERVEAEARRGATLVSLVPTALRRIDASGFRVVVIGGSTPPDGLPANVATTYGMTETGSGVVYDGIPLAGVEVAIGDGRLGATGEVLLRCPMLLRCYRDGHDPRTAGGWFPTGDAGELDGAGELRVFGRMAEVIVTGGEKVWPAPVETVIARHPGVAGVAVVGRPDPEWGSLVVAVVEPTDPARPPSLEELRMLVKEQLPPWAAPRDLVVTPKLARTPSGKVRRREVEALLTGSSS